MKCEHCREIHFVPMPKLKCWAYNPDCREEDDAVAVCGSDLGEAAEYYSDWEDRNSVEYPSEKVVLVREDGGSEWTRFRVTMEACPVYTAREDDEE